MFTLNSLWYLSCIVHCGFSSAHVCLLRVEKSRSREYRFIDERIRFVRVEFWLHICCIKIENVNLGEKSLYINSCTRCQWYGYNLFSLKILVRYVIDSLIPRYLTCAYARIVLGLMKYRSLYHDRSLSPRLSRIMTLLDEHGYVNALSHAETFSRSVFFVGKRSVYIFLALYLLAFAFPLIEPYPSFPWTNIVLFFSINQSSIHYTEWNCSVLHHDKHWSVVDKVHCVYYFRFVRCSRIKARNIRVNRSSC